MEFIMKKILILLLFICLSLLAKPTDTQETKHTFSEDLFATIQQSLDSNVTNDIKLNNISDYLKNIKFNDKVNKKKYKYNIMGHYENYMLLDCYSPNNLVEKHWKDGIRDPSKDYKRDHNEAQFQLSIKVPLYGNFLNTGADLFTAYTQNSYWQVYDTKHSSPFRETNYQPELFLEWHPDKRLGESTLKITRLSFIHQSNGQDVGKSRSWNRTEMFFLLQHENIFYGLNFWDRWDEKDKVAPNETEGNDNKHLVKYIGAQRYFVKYKSDKFNIGLYYQTNLFDYDPNLGNIRVDLTLPSINQNLKFFIRYFNGYGESLIDYDVKIQRISFGIMIADWI
jgi:phospholipase A1